MYNGFSALATDDGDEDDGAAAGEAEMTAAPALASAPVPLHALADGEHPFICDPGDHAETPLVAFQDIAPLLRRLAGKVGLTPATLLLYDPFFCTGACVTHLRSLGFESVYNRNEDFYRVAASSAVPSHNVLVSNPPYTGQHLENTFRFCWANQGRPFFLLVPQFVARKPWLLEHQEREANRGRGAASRLLYLGPKTQPYVFSAPAARADVVQKRGGVTAAAETTSSFPVSAGKFQAVWVIGGLGTQREPLVEWWRRVCAADADCVLASSPAELPQFAAVQTPAERRWKRKARDGNEEGEGEEQQPPIADAGRQEKRGRGTCVAT